MESRGSPNFKVAGKTFAIYVINHHGDGRVALWLEATHDAQMLYSEMEPEYYFVPPYVGPKGWLGVELNRGLSWPSISERVREAYEKVAPQNLVRAIGEPFRIKGKVKDLSREEIDPLQAPASRKFLDLIDSFCRDLPEVTRSSQFGNPVWKAGKKTFVCVHRYDSTLKLQVWVGLDQQVFLIADDRYSVPAYVGHNGWIDLDVEKDVDWREVKRLILESYRHFALKRMLQKLELGSEEDP